VHARSYAQIRGRPMETYSKVPQRVFAELFAEPPDVTAPVGAWVNDTDVARSEENILQWMSYLPEDCIRTMIAMGWDVTT
jgi:hypothetical protein